ncbi:MAG TPA: circadian clock KaiB family protein [Anaerolineae bacterium]|nr:circadian clock KaiB family protein [Anaerolineae bacterium]
MSSNGAPTPGTDTRLVLRLYIAGRGPNSVRAMANLDGLAETYGRDGFEIEIVDVLAEPQRALRDHVLVTPTLVKLAPPPTIQIAGDLSEGYRVIHALGLDPASLARPGE